MSGRALLLVGHGSHLSADSSAPVYTHAARLRELGIFDEVFEAFWKEEPSLRDALDLVESSEIYVVPLFLAEGYFTRQVVPRELGVRGPVTRRAGRTIHYCPPLGTHPAMASLVVRRSMQMPGLVPGDLQETTLLIIGHGTPRSRTSRDTVYRLVDEVRAMGLFGAVDCGFLDEDPRISDVLSRTDARRVALVPYFLAEGWHTATTIPEEIGLAGLASEGGHTARWLPEGSSPDPTNAGLLEAAESAKVSGDGGAQRVVRRVWYSPPIGTMPEVADLILDLACFAAEAFSGDMAPQAGAGDDRPVPSGCIPAERVPSEESSMAQDTSPASRIEMSVPITEERPGRESGRLGDTEHAITNARIGGHTDLAGASGAPQYAQPGADPACGGSNEGPPSAVARARQYFLEWLIEQRGLSRVMQVAIDRSADSGYRLTNVVDSTRPGILTPITSLALLRDLVRFNAEGEYRPLRTWNDLPSGWVIDLPDEGSVWEALSIIYPAALLHWYLSEAGELDIVPFQSWADRQTGIYEVVRDLTENDVAGVVDSCCGRCLRQPLWGGSPRSRESSRSRETSNATQELTLSPGGGAQALPSALEIPCREPCTLFATIARDFGEQA